MQSAGGEGGGEEEGREGSSRLEETHGKLQDSRDKAAEDDGVTVPPAQEVCCLIKCFIFYLLLLYEILMDFFHLLPSCSDVALIVFSTETVAHNIK